MSRSVGHSEHPPSSARVAGMHPPVGQHTFADRVAALSSPARQLHRVILQAFLENGCAPRLSDLRPVARASGVGLERLLTELAIHDVIQRSAYGAIHVAYPFSSTATPHRVQLEGRPSVFAMCVIDALGLPFMARRSATIRTEDPVDGTPISIGVGCGLRGKPVSSLVHWLPATAVVLVNKPPRGMVIQAECTCPYLNAFASRDTAERWRAIHTDLDVQVLTQQQAVREARKIFGAVLEKPRKLIAAELPEQEPSPVGERGRHPQRASTRTMWHNL